MSILILETNILWKSDVIGTPTRRIPEHYYGRSITAKVGGNERMFRFNRDELELNADEDDMITAIKSKVEEENKDQE